MKNIISLGAGVQSSVVALMADRGEWGEKPEAAVFADVQWEPPEVYTHLDWLEEQLSFPVYRVTIGDIRANALDHAKRHTKEELKAATNASSMPFFMEGAGMLFRQCTRNYKIDPVNRKIRELLGLKRGQQAPRGEVLARTWIGISIDEASRMKDSPNKWKIHYYPLIDSGMSRDDCKAWFAKEYPGRNLPRSACVACPYRSNKEWHDMKENEPSLFADAVDFDNSLRKHGDFSILKGKAYVHSSKKPLADIDFRTLEDMGQINMFENECEGMCGV